MECSTPHFACRLFPALTQDLRAEPCRQAACGRMIASPQQAIDSADWQRPVRIQIEGPVPSFLPCSLTALLFPRYLPLPGNLN